VDTLSVTWTEKKGFTLRVESDDEYFQITCPSLEQAVMETIEIINED
jgi:hypothetical protein